MLVCMTEQGPLPHLDDVTSTLENGTPENIGNLITSFVEQQTHSESTAENRETGLSDPREVQVYNMLMDLLISAPPLWQTTVSNVASGYGSLIYDRMPQYKQVTFLLAQRSYFKARENADLVLTEEEGGILKNIAHAVGVEYDPGTPENLEKRTFPLADLEKRAPDRSTLSPIDARLLDLE